MNTHRILPISPKPGAALALTLLASRLEEAEDDLLPECDYDHDEDRYIPNRAARAVETMRDVRGDLTRLAREIEPPNPELVEETIRFAADYAQRELTALRTKPVPNEMDRLRMAVLAAQIRRLR